MFLPTRRLVCVPRVAIHLSLHADIFRWKRGAAASELSGARLLSPRCHWLRGMRPSPPLHHRAALHPPRASLT